MIQKLYIFSFLLILSATAADRLSPSNLVHKIVTQKTQAIKIPQEIRVDEESPLFNTRYLANPVEVERELLARGFKSVQFKTEDGIDLHGLYRDVKHPRYSVVLSAGFLPGRMTGLASFIELLSKTEANILFYDARGKGKSGGFAEFLKLWRYGVDDYKDVEAAIHFLHKQDHDLPIYVYGCCAGAFHSARALIEMSKKSTSNGEVLPVLSKINGLIFDSGWSSVPETSISALTSFFDNQPFYIRYPVKGLLYPSLMMYNLFYHWRYNSTSSLYDSIHQLPCPMLVVHSRNDALARYDKVLSLLARMFTQYNIGIQPVVFLWVLEKSKHAVHHIKYKQLYANVLMHFIRHTLQAKAQKAHQEIALVAYQGS